MLTLGILRPATASEEPIVVYVLIPEVLSPFEREEKYESPIHAALKVAGLGEVVGGGTQMGPLKPDGSRDVVHIGVDVDIFDLERGLNLLKETLMELGVPVGTTLEIRSAEPPFEIQLNSRGWERL